MRGALCSLIAATVLVGCGSKSGQPAKLTPEEERQYQEAEKNTENEERQHMKEQKKAAKTPEQEERAHQRGR